MAKGTRSTTEVVAEALDVHRGATVAQLSEAAGLGRSAVSKALVELEAVGNAIRSEGGRDGGRRLADLWSPAHLDDAAPATEADDAPIDAAEPKRETDTKLPTDRERLGKGALGSLVLAHLAENPNDEHGAVAIAKALGGRSSGAVGNALLRLCDSGDAVLTSASPRRYRFAERATRTTGARRAGAKAGVR